MTVRVLALGGATLAALTVDRRRTRAINSAQAIGRDAQRRADRLADRLEDALARGDEPYAAQLDAAWQEQADLRLHAALDVQDMRDGRRCGRLICCYVTAIGRRA
jgi:hypothetical protein